MFTGIITDIGEISELDQLKSGLKIKIKTEYDPKSIEIGASIACAGTCLTVTELPESRSSDRWFVVEAWEEALRLTSIGSVKIGDKINLERALKMGDELGGHMVSGHVDGKAEIIEKIMEGDAVRFRFKAPDDLAIFIAPKGSVTLDGTSLTINEVDGSIFDVLLIKHTQEVTTWGQRQVGDMVNIEIDQMARHVARLVEHMMKRNGA
ncbi:MAG: riboflavin synthase [Lentilitoribacter sp.]